MSYKNFLLQTRRTPSTTLFPYTTLFRSLPDFQEYGLKLEKPGTIEAENTRPLGVFLRDVMKLNMKNFRVFGPDEKDRKSTRLNSSHVAISYAVFCFKNKK